MNSPEQWAARFLESHNPDHHRLLVESIMWQARREALLEAAQKLREYSSGSQQDYRHAADLVEALDKETR